MRSIAFTIAVVMFGLVSFGRPAAADPYTRQNRIAFERAVAYAQGTVNAAGTVQASITAERNAYAAGMASADWGTRMRAKQRFVNYLGRLHTALLAAENAHSPAVGACRAYARSLSTVQRTAPQGRQVALICNSIDEARIQLGNTRRSVEQERYAAATRQP